MGHQWPDEVARGRDAGLAQGVDRPHDRGDRGARAAAAAEPRRSGLGCSQARTATAVDCHSGTERSLRRRFIQAMVNPDEWLDGGRTAGWGLSRVYPVLSGLVEGI